MVAHTLSGRGARRRRRGTCVLATRAPLDRRRLVVEQMEDRCLLSITWVEQGPGPILDGQCEAPPDNQVVGAVEALVADPSNNNIVYAGTVAGGVWKTTNFLQVGGQPTWTPLTDQFPSLAIGALAMSPLDASYNTLFAGTGNFKSGGDPNGLPIGILRTTDGGATWTQLGQVPLRGRNIRSVVPTTLGGDLAHQVVLVAAENGGGVFRSVDGGVNFVRISESSGLGDGLDNDADGQTDEFGELNLPPGSATHLVADPGDPNRFFAAIDGQGVFRSTDGGQRWARVLVASSQTTRIELSVSAAAGNTV